MKQLIHYAEIKKVPSVSLEFERSVLFQVKHLGLIKVKIL